MPNRIISELTWKSKKVRAINPPEWRAEYTWLIPLFNDRGVCELDSEVIWATAYAISRPGWAAEDVGELIEELIRVGLWIRYVVDDKVYVYLAGCDKAGLLPKPSERHSTLPLPPDDGGKIVGSRFGGDHGAAEGRDERVKNALGTSLGLGLGSGLGVGSGAGAGSGTGEDQDLDKVLAKVLEPKSNPLTTTNHLPPKAALTTKHFSLDDEDESSPPTQSAKPLENEVRRPHTFRSAGGCCSACGLHWDQRQSKGCA